MFVCGLAVGLWGLFLPKLWIKDVLGGCGLLLLGSDVKVYCCVYHYVYIATLVYIINAD